MPSIEQMRLELAQGGQPEVKAPTSELGFYSPIHEAALNISRKTGNAQAFMNDLRKYGAGKDEIEHTAVEDFLKTKPTFTREEVVNHIAQNAPKVEATVLGARKADLEPQVEPHEIRVEPQEPGWWFIEGPTSNTIVRQSPHVSTEEEAREFGRRYFNGHIAERNRERNKNADDTKYSKYQLPGGENYREILLKLPSKTTTHYLAENQYGGSGGPFQTEQEARQFAGARGRVLPQMGDQGINKSDYRSPHWEGHPNVLAHIRTNDRTDADGKKVLFVEEIQSDWGQEGKKKGFASNRAKPLTPEEHNRAMGLQVREANNDELSAAERAELSTLQDRHYRSLKGISVPDGPFVTNTNDWVNLALKHVMKRAADEGYDRVAFINGEQSADRYDLSQQVEELMIEKNGDNFTVAMKPIGQGYGDAGRWSGKAEQLPDVVGKELADKIAAQPEGRSYIGNVDLKVGGKGMKDFYDNIVPSQTKALLKKFGGGQMGHVVIQDRSKESNLPLTAWIDEPPAFMKQPGFDITPEMRKRLSKPIPYAEGGVVHKASGGSIMPTLAQMRMELAKHNPADLQRVGLMEALDLKPKAYVAPEEAQSFPLAPGGVSQSNGMPIGGVDRDSVQPGQQMMPPQQGMPSQGGQQAPQMAGPGQMPQGMDQSGMPPSAPQGGQSNILSLTPQGQAMSAMRPQGLAEGGSAKSIDEMKDELAKKKAGSFISPYVNLGTRVVFHAKGSGNVQGINVPRHMWEGGAKIAGMKDVNAMRAKVYGSENRDPLTIGQIGRIHKDTLNDHFSKPIDEQISAEKEALSRLREAGHIGKTANTLDESEKLDTVRHEHDDEGRTHVGYASKGVAGHALYTSGQGKKQKFHVLNTCPGQTEGCGGGKDAQGIVDTTKGTCFAPSAEAQYPGAAVRRACHEQAKHDPAMTRDWILAHTGSMRDAANSADKKNQRMLFRPNVVDETDTSSRHVIRHLNEQRKQEGKPGIIANSYGKTNELHDPENGYYVTHSNVGPKVKGGREISENIGRDKQRVSNTIMAANSRGEDFKNEQGNNTPPKGSYMVTNVKRGSPLSQKMQEHITHAKYWSTGRSQNELSDEEKREGPEGHFGPNGKPTTPDKAHYGHITTKSGMRYDYQKQHILHPRLVQVGENKDGTPHMIPTDSRFKDTEFLPKNRFKTKNGKEAGHILMTTPTESTSNLGHETSFTHHVDESSIKHAKANKGEYEIDKPEDQEKARGKEYVAPQEIKMSKTMKLASGGSVSGRHPGLSDDDFHAFPERNYAAQRHLSMRMDPEEREDAPRFKRPVLVMKDTNLMRHEMMTRRKGK